MKNNMNILDQMRTNGKSKKIFRLTIRKSGNMSVRIIKHGHNIYLELWNDPIEDYVFSISLEVNEIRFRRFDENESPTLSHGLSKSYDNTVKEIHRHSMPIRRIKT